MSISRKIMMGASSQVGTQAGGNLVENDTNGAYITVTGGTDVSTTSQEQWILSAWIDRANADLGYVFRAGTVFVQIGVDGQVGVRTGSAVVGEGYRLSGTGKITSAAGLQHLLVSVDLSRANADKFQVYVDDADVTMGTISDSTGAASTGTTWHFLNLSGSVVLDADAISDLYLALGETLDLDTESERRKFISAAGDPVGLGADGSTPTGTQPLFYWGGSMVAADWNDGTQLGSDGGSVAATNDFTDV